MISLAYAGIDPFHFMAHAVLISLSKLLHTRVKRPCPSPGNYEELPMRKLLLGLTAVFALSVAVPAYAAEAKDAKADKGDKADKADKAEKKPKKSKKKEKKDAEK